MQKAFLAIFSLMLLVLSVKAQIKSVGVPYIRNYTVEEYAADGQNWDIVQNQRGIMYFANNRGVLEYDGVNWRTIKVSNNSAVKSLAINSENKIYAGAKGEMGVLEPDSSGTLLYKSLLPKIPVQFHNFADVWKIYIASNNSVIFQTTSGLYIFKNDTFTVLKADKESGIRKSFYINNQFYADYTSRGLMKLNNNKLELIKGSEIFASEPVKAVLPYKQGSLLIVTQRIGVYVYQNNAFTKTDFPVDTYLNSEVYQGYILPLGYYGFALVSKGFLVCDKNMNPVRVINSAVGLQDNRVSSVFVDSHDGVWLSLSNGISFVSLYSPYSEFKNDYSDLSGTVRSLVLKDSILYVAADALYSVNWQRNKLNPVEHQKFKEIKNTKGRFSIWKLDTLHNEIYGGGEKGLFKVAGDSVINFDKQKDRNVRSLVFYNKIPNHIITGGGEGLTVYHYDGSRWVFKNWVEGFPEYCRHIAEDDSGLIWMSDKSKGVFKIKLKPALDSVEYYTKYDTLKGLPSNINNYLFETHNGLILGTEDGMYKYNYKTDKFEPFTSFNKALKRKIKADFLYHDTKNNYWLKEVTTDPKDPNMITWDLRRVTFTSDTTADILSIPYSTLQNNIYSFSEVGDGSFIIGNKQGFVHYDETIFKNFEKEFKANIRNILLLDNDSIIFGGTFTDKKNTILNEQDESFIPEIEFEYNGLKFIAGPGFYEYPEKVKYRYFLEGNDKGWTDWKVENTKEYSNLSPGTYTFYVEVKNVYGVSSTKASFRFKILAPWYLTIWAYMGYAFLAIFTVVAIVKIYTRKLVKDKERLEFIITERTAEIRQQKEEIEAQRDELEIAKEQLSEKNKSITDSINYAKRIQEAMLPLEAKIQQALPEHFILFKPRDIVSGDFYWFAERDNKIIITAVDCTGHGVPGAFMSMIGAEILTTIVTHGITDSSEILFMKNKYVRTALKQETTENQDGMDMALCVYDRDTKKLHFSGAKNPLIYIQNNELIHVKGDKQSIGGHQIEPNSAFNETIIDINGPTYLYIFTDGYPDQFGGEKSRKFMIKSLKDMLFEIHQKPFPEQKVILNDTIMNWMKGTEQTDDILVIGFKIS